MDRTQGVTGDNNGAGVYRCRWKIRCTALFDIDNIYYNMHEITMHAKHDDQLQANKLHWIRTIYGI